MRRKMMCIGIISLFLMTGLSFASAVEIEAGIRNKEEVEVPTSVTTSYSSELFLIPNGDGSLKDWRNPPKSEPHWVMVDDPIENPDESETTIRTDCYKIFTYPWHTDTFNIPDPDTSYDTYFIFSVTVYLRIKNPATNGAAYNVAPLIHTNGNFWENNYEGKEYPTTSDWATFSYTWNYNPSTRSGWTWEDIKNLEIGARLKHIDDSQIWDQQLTQVYAKIEYGEMSYPDLIITSFRTEPVIIDDFELPGFREILFDVKNMGGFSAIPPNNEITIHMTCVWPDGSEHINDFDIEDINELKPGESFTFNSAGHWHGGSPVGSAFTFLVDSENVIDEGPTGESNNQATYKIPLGKQSNVRSYSILEKLLDQFPILQRLLKI